MSQEAQLGVTTSHIGIDRDERACTQVLLEVQFCVVIINLKGTIGKYGVETNTTKAWWLVLQLQGIVQCVTV